MYKDRGQYKSMSELDGNPQLVTRNSQLNKPILRKMFKPLPSSMIDTATLSQVQNGQTFYYEITYTVFGEVLSVEDDISDLPLAAQKMLLGAQKNEVTKHLQKGLPNLKYLIPLIILGNNINLPAWLQPIVDGIQDMQEQMSLDVKNNPQDYIQSRWVRALYSSKQYINTYNIQISKYFVGALLEENELIHLRGLSDLERCIAVDKLINDAKQYWDKKEIYERIIDSLTKVSTKEDYKALVSIIFDKQYGKKARISAIRVIERLAYENARYPLTAALGETNFWIRVYAVKALSKFVDKKEIVDTLLHAYLHDQNDWVRIRAVQGLGFVKNDEKLITALGAQLKILDKEEILFHTVQALKRMDCPQSRYILRQIY